MSSRAPSAAAAASHIVARASGGAMYRVCCSAAERSRAAGHYAKNARRGARLRDCLADQIDQRRCRPATQRGRTQISASVMRRGLWDSRHRPDFRRRNSTAQQPCLLPGRSRARLADFELALDLDDRAVRGVKPASEHYRIARKQSRCVGAESFPTKPLQVLIVAPNSPTPRRVSTRIRNVAKSGTPASSYAGRNGRLVHCPGIAVSHRSTAN
jgi:hypothetical protein